MKKYTSSELAQFTYREIDKIGSILSLIAKKTKGIYITRLMKYLYLIDETSVKEIGVPVLPFNYKVAEKGPLITELWKILPKNIEFKEYIDVSFDKSQNGHKIISIGEPKLVRFSQYELELIDKIISNYAAYETDEIIDYLHTHKDSLWKGVVENESIDFNSNKISNHSINLRNIVEGNDTNSYLYDSYFATRNK